MKIKYFKTVFLLTLGIGFNSINAFAQRDVKSGQEMTIPEYVTKYAPIAQQEMQRTGIPASITLAQGILESRFGNSKLAVKANNHFGIKCGNSWTGPKVYYDDDEKNECFRKYQSALHSYVDHSNFLTGRERYSALFKLDPKDYKGWSHGLQKAGYATNPNYGNLLIRLIEERNLQVYDSDKKRKTLTAEEEDYLKTMDNKLFTFNGIKTIISQPNEVAADIVAKHDITLKQLLRYNDMNDGDYIPPGSRIYLEPKKTKGNDRFHKVEESDDMHTISQAQGIKLKTLYKRNKMTWGQEPSTAEILCLRSNCANPPKLKSDKEIKEKIKQQIEKRLDDAVKENKKQETKPEVKSQEVKSQEVKAAVKEPEMMNEFEDNSNMVAGVKMQDEGEIPPSKEDETFKQPVKTPEVKKEAPSTGRMVALYHDVVAKETLYGITTKYNANVEDIKKWNAMSSNSLFVGQRLIVGYVKDFGNTPLKNDNPVIKEEKPVIREEIKNEPKEIKVEIKEEFKEEKKEAIKQPVAEKIIEKKPKYHTVAPQETLYRISVNHKVTVDEIKKWNSLKTTDISVGQKLIVGYTEVETEKKVNPIVNQAEVIREEKPVVKEEPVSIKEESATIQEELPKKSSQPSYHKVQQGETLFSIARQYNLTVDDLVNVNRLPSNEIKPGQVLKLR